MKQTALFFDDPDPPPEQPKAEVHFPAAPRLWTQRLTAAEIRRADEFADRVEEYRSNLPSLFESRDRPHLRRMSHRAELALSIRTGLPWTGGSVLITNGRRLPDVGDDIEVRWSHNPHLLRLQKRDKKLGDSRFVLATGEEDVFTFHGWAYGDEVVQEQYWDTSVPYPCYSYPVRMLYPMEELR